MIGRRVATIDEIERPGDYAGPIHGYTGPLARRSVVIAGVFADFRVWCKECGEPLCFIGVPPGLSPREPRVEIGAQELRCPMRPQSSPPEWGSSGLGFDVEVNRARTN